MGEVHKLNRRGRDGAGAKDAAGQDATGQDATGPKPAPCPVCGKPATQKARPFCSVRCANIDLGRWLGGNYRVETEEAPENGDEPRDGPLDPEPTR